MPKCVKNMCVEKNCVCTHGKSHYHFTVMYFEHVMYVRKSDINYLFILYFFYISFSFVRKIKICSREYVISAYNLKKYEENKIEMWNSLAFALYGNC